MGEKTQTPTEIIIAAGWRKLSRTAGECGEALTASGSSNGLACSRPAKWVPADADAKTPIRCAQHAAAVVRRADEPETLHAYAEARGFVITEVTGRMPIEARRKGESLLAMNFRSEAHARTWLSAHRVVLGDDEAAEAAAEREVRAITASIKIDGRPAAVTALLEKAELETSAINCLALVRQAKELDDAMRPARADDRGLNLGIGHVAPATIALAYDEALAEQERRRGDSARLAVDAELATARVNFRNVREARLVGTETYVRIDGKPFRDPDSGAIMIRVQPRGATGIITVPTSRLTVF